MMKMHYCISPADRAVVGSGSAVLDSYMALRLQYGTGMGLMHGISSDHDVYDDLADTRYFIRLDRRPPDIRAGIRATRVASLYDSLTWRMLNATPGTQQAVNAGERTVDGTPRAGRGR